MSSILKVDTIQDQSGNNIINENADTITIGASGDTITIPSGATLDASGATLTLPTTIEVDTIEPQSGTSLTLGASGDTITIPSGATITNSGTATGFGGGKVLQVITATDGTQRNTTSTSFVTASNTLSVTITPSSVSSKIFITMSSSGLRTSGATGSVHYTIFRGATNLGDATGGMSLFYASESANDWGFPLAMSITDSPSTTSATTYQVYFKTTNASNTARLQQYPVLGTITAFEIEG
jgi:hypothetical protein